MKTVLITGATGDIGKAIAREFKGWNVVVHYHKNEKDADNLLKEVTGIKVQADIKDENQVEKMFEAINESFGQVDVLINNSGVQLIKMLVDTSLSEWHNVVDVSLTGAFLVTKYALKDMMYKGGKIINISSIWGQKGASCEVAYSSAKAGLIGFTRALAKEYSNINVNCICPGVIQSRMNEHLTKEAKEELLEEIPLRRFGTPKEVAEACLFLAEKGDYITGQVIGVDGGF